jgi:hypothetical protein
LQRNISEKVGNKKQSAKAAASPLFNLHGGYPEALMNPEKSGKRAVVMYRLGVRGPMAAAEFPVPDKYI